jgi:hypothetical protein
LATPTAAWEVVNPGNQEYQKGDQINRPAAAAVRPRQGRQ